MTKRIALIVSLIVWGTVAFLSSTSQIADNHRRTEWMRAMAKSPSDLILPTPEQDLWKGVEMGLGRATFFALVLWLTLRSMVPIDERRSIGKAVINEAVDAVKDGLPLPKAIEDKARGGFWERLNGILGR